MAQLTEEEIERRARTILIERGYPLSSDADYEHHLRGTFAFAGARLKVSADEVGREIGKAAPHRWLLAFMTKLASVLQRVQARGR